jgi:UDPglucose 6-dehydrogenase
VRIAVMGAGHVGTVCGACLSAIGHEVSVVDIDRDRVAQLESGQTPFVEPGLPELLARGRAEGRLSFRADPASALSGAQAIFLCVNTESGPDGSVDLSPIHSAVRSVAEVADPGALLVNRSTAPVGTAEYIRSLTDELRGSPMSVAVNPEFLAEGTAVRDFLSPDRILVGVFEDRSVAVLSEIYDPIVSQRLPSDLFARLDGHRGRGSVPFLVTDTASAELAKYAANSALAVKISLINEMAGIAEELGADITKVAEAVGLDRRIGPQFLRAGIGWGGSCFPKDIVALQGMAETRGLKARMLRAANEVNAEQRSWVVRRLNTHFKTLFGRRVALLGLAFKPGTDDLRNAPALEVAAQLAKANVRVRAFDPVVKDLPPDLRDTITLFSDPISLAAGADALVVVTEWPEFRGLDLAGLRSVMHTPLFLDGRNLFDPALVRAAGFIYLGVGQTRAGATPAVSERGSALGPSTAGRA